MAGIFASTPSQNEFPYALIFVTKSAVRMVPVAATAVSRPRAFCRSSRSEAATSLGLVAPAEQLASR